MLNFIQEIFQMVLLFLGLSAGSIFIVLIAILLLFGSKEIPTIARSLGKGIRDIKNVNSTKWLVNIGFINNRIEIGNPNYLSSTNSITRCYWILAGCLQIINAVYSDSIHRKFIGNTF